MSKLRIISGESVSREVDAQSGSSIMEVIRDNGLAVKETPRFSPNPNFRFMEKCELIAHPRSVSAQDSSR